jgi:hypothetical protein
LMHWPPLGWPCTKVSSTMNTETPSNTTACISCGDPSIDPAGVETNCQSDRCATRIAVGWGYSLERIHELALEEDLIRKYNVVTIENLLFYLAQATTDRDAWHRKARDGVDASDYRVHHLWVKLYRALDGDIEQDETWDLIMSEIPGVPDLRVKTFDVEIPLDTLTITVEAKDEDEAIELAIEQACNDYSIEDVINQRYVEASEA